MTFRIVYGKDGRVFETELTDDGAYRQTMQALLADKCVFVPKIRVMQEVFLSDKRVARRDFRTVERALRAFDEVGISNELCEFLEAHEDADWVCFGGLFEEEADLSAWEV